MKNKTILLIICIAVSFITGCSTKPITMNYSPSSVLSAEGNVEISAFRYIPGESEKIKPNQIRNTAMGSAIFEQDISTIIQESVFKELRFVGIKPQSDNRVLSGEIIEFLIDDLGYSVDWTLEIRYIVKDKTTNSTIYESTKIIEKNTSKFVNIFGSLNEVIKLNIEELIKDPEFIKAIN